MSGKAENTKRIAKNTIILYIRMVIVLLISLYTSRVILKALGVDDFGLYNVVGGVVGLLTFFNGTMAKSTQRFLNVAMVKSKESVSRIFESSITVHLLFAGVFLLLGETIGLWFLNTQLRIPEGRDFAANIVYQVSLLSFCASIITIPYSAAVVAYEKMTFLAVVSIVDAILKLGISVFLLYYSDDRLVLYGILLLSIQILNFLLYFMYCQYKHNYLKFRLSFDKENFKQIFGFVSWTLVGQFAVVGCNQGNVVLVNMFHAVAANAAMSVGNQVNAAVANLTTNFQTAFNPQITKSYAEENYDYLRKLVFLTSKISFCIMFAVAFPIALNIDWVLDVWLDEVPLMSSTFAILFMVNGIINAISMPFNFTVLSSSNIRNFQLVTTIVFLLDLPITYLLFRSGMLATTVLWVKIGVISLMFFVRAHFASRVVPTIDLWSVIKEVLFPLATTTVISITLAYALQPKDYTSLSQVFYTTIVEVISIMLMFYICLNKQEKMSIFKLIKR